MPNYLYRINDKNVTSLLTNPRGMVGRDLRKRARLVERQAKVLVGVDSGALKKSIHTSLAIDARGLYANIGSNLYYALAHHEGTRPHIIRSSSPGKLLRFPVRGRIVMVDSVRHPGTKPNPYLRLALPAAIL